MKIFNRVILYARQHRANPEINESLHRVAEFLQHEHIQTYLDRDTADFFDIKLPILQRELMGKRQDLIVVVGGDGSLLSAARMAIKVNVPVIGINRGRLGFLTDILPQDIEHQLKAVLMGEFTEEYRFLLRAQISNSEIIDYEGDALNDIVLSRGKVTHLVEFEVFINHRFVSRYQSDGMIVSTPTGSTAYALSAGGPIMHPQLNAVVLVPMFSHSLNSRPIVVDGEVQIDLKISEYNESDLQISCDGHESRLVKPAQIISIKKNAQNLRLLHPVDYHYYDTLRSKLGWELKHQG